jgi:hypothetical protein
MRVQRLLSTLTLANSLVLALTLATMRTAAAHGDPDVVRARSFQLVDEQGRVRASLEVLPAATSAHGDGSPETVILRLISERGRPSVKISASEEASGLSLAGPSGTSSTWVILEAKGRATSLKMRSENGRERVVEP